MKAIVTNVSAAGVNFNMMLNGCKVGEYFVRYENIKITNVEIGQVFNAQKDMFGGWTFWREGQ